MRVKCVHSLLLQLLQAKQHLLLQKSSFWLCRIPEQVWAKSSLTLLSKWKAALSGQSVANLANNKTELPLWAVAFCSIFSLAFLCRNFSLNRNKCIVKLLHECRIACQEFVIIQERDVIIGIVLGYHFFENARNKCFNFKNMADSLLFSTNGRNSLKLTQFKSLVRKVPLLGLAFPAFHCSEVVETIASFLE